MPKPPLVVFVLRASGATPDRQRAIRFEAKRCALAADDERGYQEDRHESSASVDDEDQFSLRIQPVVLLRDVFHSPSKIGNFLSMRKFAIHPPDRNEHEAIRDQGA